MQQIEENGKMNAAVILLGALVAVTAIGLAGRSVYGHYAHPDERVRDVKDIISQCHATIHEMDRALKRLQPSRV